MADAAQILLAVVGVAYVAAIALAVHHSRFRPHHDRDIERRRMRHQRRNTP